MVGVSCLAKYATNLFLSLSESPRVLGSTHFCFFLFQRTPTDNLETADTCFYGACRYKLMHVQYKLERVQIHVFLCRYMAARHSVSHAQNVGTYVRPTMYKYRQCILVEKVAEWLRDLHTKGFDRVRCQGSIFPVVEVFAFVVL